MKQIKVLSKWVQATDEFGDLYWKSEIMDDYPSIKRLEVCNTNNIDYTLGSHVLIECENTDADLIVADTKYSSHIVSNVDI
jgi:hypothetical protein